MTCALKLTGQRFGRLIVSKDAGSVVVGRKGQRARASLCQCDCGETVTVTNMHLRSGHTQSCGCLQRDRVSLPYGDASDNLAFYRIKQGAEKRGLLWALSEADVRRMLGAPCYWCGDVRVNQLGKAYRLNGRLGYNGLDRLDNNVGYTEANAVPCCGPCNRMKGTMSTDEFVRRCAEIVRKHQA